MFEPSVTLLGLVVKACREALAVAIEKRIPNRLAQTRLVLLDRQQVVRSSLDYSLGDLSLAAHRVDREQTTLELENSQQGWDGGDLVGLAIGSELPEYQGIGR